jgi:hypothetical protein
MTTFPVPLFLASLALVESESLESSRPDGKNIITFHPFYEKIAQGGQ